jgi:hypothetical protein
MNNKQEVIINTYEKEKLRGYLVEPKKSLFKDTGLDNLIKLGLKFDGVWLLRIKDQKISFISNDDIVSIERL